MIRALSILAAVAALAVSAAPVGSAHSQPFDDGAGPAAAALTKAAPPKPPSGSNWVSIDGGGKDRGWFHGTGRDGRSAGR